MEKEKYYMRAIDMTAIYKKYRGKWVALKGPTETIVIASGKTLKDTLERARQKGVVLPFVLQIPRNVLPLVGESMQHT